MDKKTDKIFFYILIRGRNAFGYFDRCIKSVLRQNYQNFKILFVDDASNYSPKKRAYIQKKLYGHVVIFNKKRKYSVLNAYEIIHKSAKIDDAVLLNLDADDWLRGNSALSYLASIYKNDPNCLITWGECVFWDGKRYLGPSRLLKKNLNIPYPKDVVQKNSYRKYPFLPLHPRTWKVWLFKKIKKQDFLRPDGSWLKFAEDQAIFYPMLEMVSGRVNVIKRPIYVYNVATEHADIKENLRGLLKDELTIRKKSPYEPLF